MEPRNYSQSNWYLMYVAFEGESHSLKHASVCKTMHGIKQNCHQGMIWVAQGLHDPSNPELGSVANLLGMIFEFLA